MGPGFVLAVSQRWPEPEQRYRDWYRDRDGNDFGLGAIQLVPVGEELWVANMIGQHGVRRAGGKAPIRYEALATALESLGVASLERDASVHMPRIGTGLAGGSWEAIEPIVTRTLIDRGVATTVYDLPAQRWHDERRMLATRPRTSGPNHGLRKTERRSGDAGSCVYRRLARLVVLGAPLASMLCLRIQRYGDR